MCLIKKDLEEKNEESGFYSQSNKRVASQKLTRFVL